MYPRPFDDEEAWREAWTCKFSSKSHTLASWLVQILNKGALGHWINPKHGTFELNWAEAAQNWYKAKKRHSRIEDASHLLHKGIQAAFPKLEELKRERTGHQCVRRSFKISDDICSTVQAIVVGTSNKERKRCKCNNSQSLPTMWPLSEHLLGFDSPIKVTPVRDSTYQDLARAAESPSNDEMIKWVMKSGQNQLLLIYQWAVKLPDFCALAEGDQKVLLKSVVNELLTVKLAYRSVDLTQQLRLGTGKIIDVGLIREHFTKSLATSVVKNIVSTLNELRLSDLEFALMQQIILFNPHTDGLSDVNSTKLSRRKIYRLLSSSTSPDRFAEMLLILPTVQGIANNFKEQLQEHSMLGIPKYMEHFMEMANFQQKL
ncbi:uncharacterized protein LOC134825303 [Bolinopsis microptera]|uniref:uncharacterized protein LOC134825269 n=1 Tax=Bolinopsis microptera TaxID=2820187 RepID=UPI003078BC57